MCAMRSYTAGKSKFQPYAVTLLLGATLLASCTHVTVPTGSNDVSAPTLITGSIESSSDIAYSDVSDDDRAIIADNLDAARVVIENGPAAAALELPWLNSLSGNSGTVSHIDTSVLQETGCVSFKTTANTIAGIKLYSGTACRDVERNFSVTTLSVADA